MSDKQTQTHTHAKAIAWSCLSVVGHLWTTQLIFSTATGHSNILSNRQMCERSKSHLKHNTGAEIRPDIFDYSTPRPVVEKYSIHFTKGYATCNSCNTSRCGKSGPQALSHCKLVNYSYTIFSRKFKCPLSAHGRSAPASWAVCLDLD